MRAWFCLLVPLAFLFAPSARAVKHRKHASHDFGSPECVAGMFRGAVYDIPENTPRLEDLLEKFEQSAPAGIICTFTLDVPLRSWLEGIPGVTNRLEWFAIDYRVDFWVEVPGGYDFTLDSDDGSLLFIDGRRIVNNDGIHSDQRASGHADLSRGMHRMRVPYYQGPRDAVELVLTVHPPHGKWKLFDIRDYRLPMAAPPPTAVGDDQRPVLRHAASEHDPLAERVYERPALDALQASPPPHEFDFYASALRFRPGVESSQYAVAVNVPAAAIQAAVGALTATRLHVVVLALLRDAAGNVVEKTSQELPLEVSYTGVPTSLHYSHPVSLPPDRYTLETAVFIREANRASVETVPFENPEYGGAALSDLVLVPTVESTGGPPDAGDPLEFHGRRAAPELSGVVSAASHPFVFFVIYPDAASEAKPRLEVELSRSGRAVARQSPAIPAPDASGAIPMSVLAPSTPGRYAVTVTVEQGSQRIERRLEYEVTGP
jgi:hypothetical protein